MGIRHNKTIKNGFLTLLFLAVFFSPFFCLAAEPNPSGLNNAFKIGDKEPLGVVTKFAGYKTDITYKELTGAIITAVLSLMGVLFLILAIYAGYNWMTARGDEEKVKKAKDTLTNAIIGLIVVFAAYAISFFIINSISTPTLKSATNSEQVE